jgi:hypothetical protein
MNKYENQVLENEIFTSTGVVVKKQKNIIIIQIEEPFW